MVSKNLSGSQKLLKHLELEVSLTCFYLSQSLSQNIIYTVYLISSLHAFFPTLIKHLKCGKSNLTLQINANLNLKLPAKSLDEKHHNNMRILLLP